MAPADRLRLVNDALRADPSAVAAQSSAWLPLESNPSVLNSYSHRVGLGAGWGWVDVWGLDPDLLRAQDLLGDRCDRPVAALILLFPCSPRIYNHRAREELSLRKNHESPGAFPRVNEGAFFIEQVAGFGNACGTIASTHALSNCFQPFDLEKNERLKKGQQNECEESSQEVMSDGKHTPGTDSGQGLTVDAPLARFILANTGRCPHDIGRALLTADDLKASSDAAAASEAAQTMLPSREADPLDHHFVTFVRRRNPGSDSDVLLELDGTKVGAIEHCATSRESFVLDAADIIRRNWVRVDPDNVEFALMALCKDGVASD